MKYADRKAFEQANRFGRGEANTAFARYFQGESYLNPLTDPKGGLFAANVTFEPSCRNHWHIHHADRGGGQRGTDSRQCQALARGQEGQLVQPYHPGASGGKLPHRVVRAGR